MFDLHDLGILIILLWNVMTFTLPDGCVLIFSHPFEKSCFWLLDKGEKFLFFGCKVMVSKYEYRI